MYVALKVTPTEQPIVCKPEYILNVADRFQANNEDAFKATTSVIFI